MIRELQYQYSSGLPPCVVIQNYCLCELCEQPFLLDASGSGKCQRALCVAVRVAWQKDLEERYPHLRPTFQDRMCPVRDDFSDE